MSSYLRLIGFDKFARCRCWWGLILTGKSSRVIANMFTGGLISLHNMVTKGFFLVSNNYSYIAGILTSFLHRVTGKKEKKQI